MKILILTNFYPPFELGGQGQSCQQVVEGLQQRGHTILVVTSMHGTNNMPATADGIHRALYLEMDMTPWRHSLTFFTKRKERERQNLRYLKDVLEQFEPDVVFIWGMWNLPRSLPALAEAQCPGKVLYRFAEYWPTLPSQHALYWRTPGRTWYSRLSKQLLGYVALALLAQEGPQPALKFEHAMCVSAATRDVLIEAGVPIPHARVIHTGLDIELYQTEEQQQGHDSQTLNLLYTGRLSANKGVETAIKAVAEIVFKRGVRNVSLSLVGSGSTDYESYLRTLVTEAGLTNYVSFLGRKPPEEIPELMRKFDVLLVPSTWPEPFARVILEGMISGLVVVATPTGGTPEIVVDGDNGLLFAPNHVEELAHKLTGLVSDSQLCRRLALTGQQTVIEKFTQTKMMDKIEHYLQEVAHFSAVEKVDAVV